MLRLGLFAIAAMLALSPAGAARAQSGAPESPRWGADRGRNEAVGDRFRPDYEATGIDVGAIKVRPTLGLELGTDSNIFYRPADPIDDIVYVVRPRVEAHTTWSRHRLAASVGMDDVRYRDFGSEHHTDLSASAEARLDIRRGAYLVLGVAQSRRAEPRSAPDSPGAAAKPVRFEDRQAHLVAVHEFGRFRGTVRLQRQGLNFKDAPLVGGGVSDQDIRDHTVTGATGRLEYALSPDAAIFGQASANTRDYEIRPPRAAFIRNSEGSEYLIGLNTDLTNLIRGEIAIGYLQQTYKDPSVSALSDIALEGKLEYFATPLTTITFAGRRRVEETVAAASASAFLTTVFGARIDHELRRNILMTGGIETQGRALEGRDRDDDLLLADVGARFLLNRRMELGAAWRFERQDSSGALAAQDYDVNRFVVSAGLRF